MLQRSFSHQRLRERLQLLPSYGPQPTRSLQTARAEATHQEPEGESASTSPASSPVTGPGVPHADHAGRRWADPSNREHAHRLRARTPSPLRSCVPWASRHTTRSHSTFAPGIAPAQAIPRSIYAIYGSAACFADGCVDTFHDHDKLDLMAPVRADNFIAWLVHRRTHPPGLPAAVPHGIEDISYDTFLRSMEMGLTDHARTHRESYLFLHPGPRVVGPCARARSGTTPGSRLPEGELPVT